jgi:hypothetical protein
MTRPGDIASCGGFANTKATRRDFLRVGWGAGLGLSLGSFLKLRSAHGAPPKPSAQSVIHIYLQGGFPHMDSFDPKPDAPEEYRGILSTIDTRLPGVRFSEAMPRTAQIADKLTLVRSMSHTEVDHSRGEHSMFTGYHPSPALVYPSMGSVVSHELGVRANMPAYIVVPTAGSQFLGSGYLSNAHGPFALGADPSRPGFRVRDLNLPRGIDEQRFARRKSWKELVDKHFTEQEKDDSLVAMDSFYQQAYGMLSSTAVKNAFSLSDEPESMKKLYGMTGLTGPLAFRNGGAARFLIARRLVEAGARFVTLTYGAWDTHAFHYRGIEAQLPILDIAFAGLITDLDQRGLLDSTLVVLNSEFGRTPKINSGGGRDHWPRVFSIVLAGGGIKRGSVYGASDALAAEPTDRPIGIEDYTHTLYHLLGIDAAKDLMSPGDRPQAIVTNGNVVQDLIA